MKYTLEINSSISFYSWQKECLQKWKNAGNHGILDVITGAGKTFFALYAIAEASKETDRPLLVKIVLPKHSLIYQWKEAIRSFYKDPPDIGEWHGTLKTNPSCPFMIYIVNSARHALSSHIVQAQKDGYSIFLIADECHHYASFENQKIFHFVNSREFQKKYYYSLGLSATVKEESRNLYLQRALGDIIFHYNFYQASKDNRIVPFFINSVALTLTNKENTNYENLSARILRLTAILRMEHPEIKLFTLSALQQLSRVDGNNSIASQVLNLILKRREIILLASYRIPCALRLLTELPDSARILVFCERISQASTLCRLIQSQLTTRVSIYHSELSYNVKRDALENFRTGQSRILISCRALDEGIDVPSADTCIILSSETTMRQHIQRLGRVLRISPNKGCARIYYLYVKEMEDAAYLPSFERTESTYYDIYRSSDLNYFGNDDLLTHPLYEDLCLELLKTYEKENSMSKYNELRKCLIEGQFCSDYLLPAEELMVKISESTDQHIKNYYYAMLLLSKINNKKGR